jgi:hypothetical protein
MFKFQFRRIPNHNKHEMLYAMVDSSGRKVNSKLLNIFITLDRKMGCWSVWNSNVRIMRSVGPLRSHLHNQTRFQVPMDCVRPQHHGDPRLSPFTLNFGSCDPPKQTFEDRLVSPSIEIAFLGKCLTFGGVYQLSKAEPKGRGHYDQYYNHKESTTGHKDDALDCYLAMETKDHMAKDEASPFPVTLWSRDGQEVDIPEGIPIESHYATTPVRWAIFDSNQTVLARSLDYVVSPHFAVWWEMYENKEVVYSGMDICISIPCSPEPHDIQIVGSDNASLNAVFVHAPSSIAKNCSPYANLTYQFILAESPTLTTTLNLVWCVQSQTWAVMSIDPYSDAQYWNRIAVSDGSGTYTDPTLCKEWHVIDSSGIYKLSPDMHCVMRPHVSPGLVTSRAIPVT